MSKKTTFDYRDDDYDLTVIVKQATVLDGLQRAALEQKIQGSEMVKYLTPEIAERPWIVTWLKQLYIAAQTLTVDIKSNDKEKGKVQKGLGLQEFLELPEALLNIWYMTIISVNPQLVPTPPPEVKEGETVREAGEESEPSGETSS
jgi:hypothetical protein